MSREEFTMPSVYTYCNNSESLASNGSDLLELPPSNYEYISLQNDQRPNTTINSGVKSKNDREEFHSLNYPLNKNKSPISSREDCSNSDHKNEGTSLIEEII